MLAGIKPDFRIKTFQELTHRVDPRKWPEVAKRYLDAIAPLREAGRLEAVLFQFPWQFGYTPENRRYLDRLLGFSRGVPAAVEFRKADWYTGRVIGGIEEPGAAAGEDSEKSRFTIMMGVKSEEWRGAGDEKANGRYSYRACFMRAKTGRNGRAG
jgi:hypothetical protein